jgi:UDP-2,4-diacetamido-2,4,6-trideoxy-beta-L-altropyranose hydrolase
MNCVFRVDASGLIGSGHLMRCLSLADELKIRGSNILFVSSNDSGNLNKIVSERGHEVYEISSIPFKLSNSKRYDVFNNSVINNDAKLTIKAIEKIKVDWLIVDHYFLDYNWELELKKHVKAILVIDDLANRKHVCNILLDQNFFGNETRTRYENLVNRECITLLGPKYSILSKDYRKAQNTFKKRNSKISRVLIFMGAVDSKGQTVQALKALSKDELNHLSVDVVIGRANKDKNQIISIASSRKNTEIYNSLPSLFELMQKADLILCSGGTTTWERCSLGLPAIVFISSENQRRCSEMLAKNDVQLLIESSNEINNKDWFLKIYELLNDSDKLKKMSTLSLKTVDGRGINRVLLKLYGLSLPIKIREATTADEKILFDWVNDYDVRRLSFNKEPIEFNHHRTWFASKLEDSNCMILIGMVSNDIPIGQVRFDIKNDYVYIDISIDRSARGFGFARYLLEESVKFWMTKGINKPLIADVFDSNKTSQKVFASMGFMKFNSDNRENVTRFILN